MLLCARDLCAANQSEPGLLNFYSTSFPLSNASVKIANAPTAAKPTKFCLISSEAYLLGGRKIIDSYKTGFVVLAFSILLILKFRKF